MKLFESVFKKSHLWLRPSTTWPRLLATVGGVAIGVAAFVSTILASRAAVAFLDEDVGQISGRAVLEVRRAGGVPLESLGKLRELSSEVLLTPIVEEACLLPQLGDLVRVLGVDLLSDLGLRTSGSLTGDGEEARRATEAMLQGNGAAISSALAEELDLEVGEAFEILVRSKLRTVEVASIFEPPRSASAWARIVLVDIALAQELTSSLDSVTRIEMIPRDAETQVFSVNDVRALEERALALLPEGHHVGPTADRRDEGGRMVQALEFNLTALSGVSILVGTVLVATALGTSVVQRRRAIALMRSLGASSRQLCITVLAEAGVIGFLGGVVGVILGWLGAKASLAGVRATTATVVEGSIAGEVELSTGAALLGLGIGVLSSLAAAFLPMREALKTPPIQGLRRSRTDADLESSNRSRLVLAVLLLGGAILFAKLPPLEDRPIWALVSALLLLSVILVLSAPLIELFSKLHGGLSKRGGAVSLRIAQSALEAGKSRAAWASGAVGVAVGLAIAMTTMVGSFRQTVVSWTEQAMRSDLFVRPLFTETGTSAGRLAPEVVATARELFGPSAVDPFYTAPAYVEGKRVSFHGAGFGVVAAEGGVPFLDGRSGAEVFGEALEQNAAVVNEPFWRRFDKGVGDTITIDTARGEIEKKIVGVYRDYSGHTGRIVIDEEDFLEIQPDEGAQSIAIFLGEDVDAGAARKELATALGSGFSLDLLLNKEVRAEILEVFERTFAVTIALQVMASIVAAIAVVTVLGALVRERRRELAIVRVLGGSQRQVAAVVLGEAGLLGAAGALAGLVVGLAVGWVLVAVVNVQSFGWTLDFVPPWRSIATTLGAVLPAAVLAGLIPAWLSARTPIAQSLREEG